MTLDQIQSERDAITEQLKPLQKRLSELNDAEDDIRSRMFIEANRVTRDEVQMSSGDGMPWHGSVWAFAKWLKDSRCDKRFCEWNGRIYFTSEIIADRMERDAPGRVCDLPTPEAKGTR